MPYSWEDAITINGRTNSVTNPWLRKYYYKVDEKVIEDCGMKIKCSFKDLLKPINLYEPKKIIYNGPATIVFWEDGSKTVVKCADMEQYNRYNAFCAALAKKIFGTNSKVNRVVKSGIVERHI